MSSCGGQQKKNDLNVEIEAIGSNITGPRTLPSQIFSSGKNKIIGVTFSTEEKRSYYISLLPDSNNIDKKLKIIKKILSSKTNLIIWDAKENISRIKLCLEIDINSSIWDPLIAEWILNPEACQMDFYLLISRLCPECCSNLPLLRSKTVTSKVKSGIEATCTWLLMQRLHKLLQEANLEKHFLNVEMKAIKCLSLMEMNGIHFSKEEANKIKTTLEKELEKLEQKAHSIIGHKFSLSSSQQISKVLFKELKLQPEKHTYKQFPSTSKEVLMKLKSQHILPEIILEWRKINFIISKVVSPLLKQVLDKNRIKGKFIYQTATGRITMHEPNLQTIPRDFDLELEGHASTLSIRKAFLPKIDYKLISVDYCQLELRILAHFSQDETLCTALNKDNDVFKSIASAWHGIDIEHVTDDQRQNSKKLCYGILYGMGPNSLAEDLKITTIEAEKFINSFKEAYPGIQIFIQKTIDHCKEKGFIETIAGRKRFLPAINSDSKNLMHQAERQAVNSSIQGSAADIAKKGMVMVEDRLQIYQQSINRQVCNPILHIHDELLYEVSSDCIENVCKIIKECCESAWQLSVKLPVKIKCGDNWGSLKELLL